MSPWAGAPPYLQFFPTLRCTRRCGFCFNRALAPMADVAPAAFRSMLDALAAAGVRTVDLLGGEPTLHAGLAELVDALAGRGMRATLSTNGAGDLALLERLEDRVGRGTLRVGVSVNDDDPTERLRDYVLRRRPILKSVGGPAFRLPVLAAEHLARPGAEYFLILRDPLERRDLPQCLSFPEHRELLAALQTEHPGVAGVACDGFVPAPGSERALRQARCPAGTLKLSALPDGSVYPCYLLFSRPEFRLGNLLTDRFADIWRDPRLDVFRSFSGNPCARTRCPFHGSCRGGCPAASLLVCGDLGAADPRCAAGRARRRGRGYIFSGSKRMPARS